MKTTSEENTRVTHITGNLKVIAFHCSQHGYITPKPRCPKCEIAKDAKVEKALKQERERIKKEIMQQTMLNDGGDTFVKLSQALFVCDSLEDRRAFLKRLHKDQNTTK